MGKTVKQTKPAHYRHYDRKDFWFYAAAFLCEILKYCKNDPMIEYSSMTPSLWAGRGRVGAWDCSSRGYKKYIDMHKASNDEFADRHSALTIGWYDIYPVDGKTNGNEIVRYQHTDDIDYLGMTALVNNYSMVNIYFDASPEELPAFHRNAAIFRKYDSLRKNHYFSKEFLDSFKNSEFEHQLVELGDNEYAFLQKKYQKAKLYDLHDEDRNSKEFTNPFDEQTPFVRIEAMISAENGDEIPFVKFDKEKDLTEQTLDMEFTKPFDMTDYMAKKVSVLGNGKKGGAISIEVGKISKHSSARYYIDTDFEGFREFDLIETDNGERNDLPFDDIYTWKDIVYREAFIYNNVSEMHIMTTGDVSGVKISDITLAKRSFEILKNPSLSIGDTNVTFLCDLKSTDFIEFDGKTAKMIDAGGNETAIEFKGQLIAPENKFTASLTTENKTNNRLRAQLTFGFSGKTIKE